MNVGDYVRTDYGLIGKIFEKYRGIQNATIYKVDVPNEDFDYTNVFKFEIVKSSPNIIDLIEVGDYVNGERVFGFGKFEYDDGTEEITSLTLDKTISCLPEDIKSIVTKEQFESIEYKVKE